MRRFGGFLLLAGMPRVTRSTRSPPLSHAWGLLYLWGMTPTPAVWRVIHPANATIPTTPVHTLPSERRVGTFRAWIPGESVHEEGKSEFDAVFAAALSCARPFCQIVPPDGKANAELLEELSRAYSGQSSPL